MSGAPTKLPRFVVIDVETSGLSSRRDRILQFAVVDVDDNGAVIDEWTTYLRPRFGRVGPTHVHGLTAAGLRSAPTLRLVAADIANRLDGAVVVGHNIDFDWAFVRRSLKRARVPLAPGLVCARLSSPVRSTPTATGVTAWPRCVSATASPSTTPTTHWPMPALPHWCSRCCWLKPTSTEIPCGSTERFVPPPTPDECARRPAGGDDAESVSGSGPAAVVRLVGQGPATSPERALRRCHLAAAAIVPTTAHRSPAAQLRMIR